MVALLAKLMGCIAKVAAHRSLYGRRPTLIFQRIDNRQDGDQSTGTTSDDAAATASEHSGGAMQKTEISGLHIPSLADRVRPTDYARIIKADQRCVLRAIATTIAIPIEVVGAIEIRLESHQRVCPETWVSFNFSTATFVRRRFFIKIGPGCGGAGV